MDTTKRDLILSHLEAAGVEVKKALDVLYGATTQKRTRVHQKALDALHAQVRALSAVREAVELWELF